MKVKEYLGQAYRLDQRINSDIEELGKLREMSSSISSPTWEERVQTSRNTDAPFVRSVFKIMELEDKINAEIDNLVELKKQIRTVIDEVCQECEPFCRRAYTDYFCWRKWCAVLWISCLHRFFGRAYRRTSGIHPCSEKVQGCQR